MTQSGPPETILKSLKWLLRPLVRLLLAHQITYPMVIRMLKSVYVEVALTDFPVVGKQQTDSRISLLTGVHRKDIKRLREGAFVVDKAPTEISMVAQLVALWTGAPEYLDESGDPKPLPRLPRDYHGHSFEELVRTVNKDIRPRVVLDEWLRLGVVSIDEDDLLSLDLNAFVPKKGADEKAFYFGQNIHDHIAAVTHNLLGNEPTLLDRSAFSDALSPASVTELAQLAEEQGMQALLAINRRAIRLERKDAKKSTPKSRINFGVYFYQEPVSDADPESEK